MPASISGPSRPLRFVHRGEVVSIDHAPATRTVLQWLREDAHRTGTKEGCNEGDCGACTVIVAEWPDVFTPTDAPLVDGLRLVTRNACLTYLPALDGKALIAVDDLPMLLAGRPHPVQDALVETHGSQCGFCTPGFVMSLVGVFESVRAGAPRPDRPGLADALAGNLCRCTGYRPILDAGEQALGAVTHRGLDLSATRQALETLRQDPALHYEEPPAPLAAEGSTAAPPRRSWAPRHLDALAALYAEHPQARLVAGATDVALWTNKQFRVLPDLIFTGDCAELRRIETRADGLWIGSAVPLESAWAALCARWPTLEEAWRRFASPPVRHAGTLGGNLANGSPIGDGAPVLMALDAELDLRHGERRRRVPLSSFYLAYQRNALAPGELLEGIFVPAVPGFVRAWKISKRFDSDISSVFLGARLHLQGERIDTVRLAWGGLAATTCRAPAVEAALEGQSWIRATLDAARQALTTSFQPLSDARSRADTRLRMADALLERLWLETRPDQPLPPSLTRVGYAPAHRSSPAGGSR